MKLSEKIGYGFGDMSSSMFWKLFSYFLPFFYSNVFGLSLADAGMLMLITRLWDAVSDPMMGIIADRTKTRWGKYRPYLLFFALPFAVCGILLFTTPENGKTVWAYVTYILMMTVYTGIIISVPIQKSRQICDSIGQILYVKSDIFYEASRSWLPHTAYCGEYSGTDRPVFLIFPRIDSKSDISVCIKTLECIQYG